MDCWPVNPYKLLTGLLAINALTIIGVKSHKTKNMKTTQLTKTLILVAMMAVCSMSAFAQPTNEHKQIPDGKWVLESIAAFEDNVQVPFSVSSIGFEVPSEIAIQQDEMILAYKETTETMNYAAALKGNVLCFSVCAEWKIAETNTLLLQWEQDIEDGTKMQTIILSYTKE